LDINGKVVEMEGKADMCNFRFQGQFHDDETGLYYNRFRYYNPEDGVYISEDPIGLAGGAALYAYVNDPNTWVDVFGLKQSVYVLMKDDEVVYIGITNDAKRRKNQHKNSKGRKKKDFDEMIIIAEFEMTDKKKERRKARDIEGSALDQNKNNNNLQNARKPVNSDEYYHSYNKDNLASDVEGIDLNSMADNGKIVK
ncbi:MAG: RHS repeat-associated core domain-containing protein, partial [Alphaproteobacteria bacterium]